MGKPGPKSKAVKKQINTKKAKARMIKKVLTAISKKQPENLVTKGKKGSEAKKHIKIVSPKKKKKTTKKCCKK